MHDSIDSKAANRFDAKFFSKVFAVRDNSRKAHV